MKGIITYLTFDGVCREAMTFYKDCLGGELDLMPFSVMPEEVPDEMKDRIMHANLKAGSATLMASDTMPGHPYSQGNNFSVSVHCESADEAERQFSALSEGGQVTMPLQETFWAARFGMLTDKFGVNWMFNFEQPRQ